MATPDSIFNIAQMREESAKSISEMGIYRSVVENVVIMDGEVEDKISILLNAVPDLGIIIAHLSLCKSRGLLTEQQYSDFTAKCLLHVQKKGNQMNFNPIYMKELGGS